MPRTIMFVFALGCVFLSLSMHARAENKLTAPFKAPFSIFSDKKNKEAEENSDNLNTHIEKNVKAGENQKLTRVYDPKNKLGITYIENIIRKAEFYLEEEDFDSAKQALDKISEWVYDATEYHTDLFKTLKNIENSEAQANVERNLAIQFAILRDRALFLESKVHIANGKQKQAVEKLVEIVRSQPKTDLGFKAYETLQEIGFTYKIEYEMIDNKAE